MKVSFVEVDTSKLSQDQITELENITNEKIREAIPVTVTVYSKDDPEFEKVCVKYKTKVWWGWGHLSQ